MVTRIVRLSLTLTGLIIGIILGYCTVPPLKVITGIRLSAPQTNSVIIFLGGLFAIFGFALGPATVRSVSRSTLWLEGRLQRTPVQDIVVGSIGLIVGLVIANLLGTPLSRIPVFGSILPTLASILLAYLSLSVAVKKRDELLSALSLTSRSRDPRKLESGEPGPRASHPKILDTSVIIDGRIVDVCQSGFVEGPLLVPSFVLEELRHIADSSDALKRNRGRRGLEVLNRIQKENIAKVVVDQRDFPGLEVDSKLLKLAKLEGGKILTNDYNLNKVAELQGVQVLNINELANAVKPVVLPGEEMTVLLIKEGNQTGQGVAYLDDGTMVVVDNGRPHIGDSVEVLVTSSLQTAAGRMIFARIKAGH
jgi:uncharacterized protein YacL